MVSTAVGSAISRHRLVTLTPSTTDRNTAGAEITRRGHRRDTRNSAEVSVRILASKRRSRYS